VALQRAYEAQEKQVTALQREVELYRVLVELKTPTPEPKRPFWKWLGDTTRGFGFGLAAGLFLKK